MHVRPDGFAVGALVDEMVDVTEDGLEDKSADDDEADDGVVVVELQCQMC